MRPRSLLFTIASLAVLFSCSETSDTQFTRLSSSKTGVKFRNTIKETPEFNVLNYGYFYNGGGVAVGDINNDGLQDIYFTGNMVASRLYLNQGNMKFKEIAEDAGVLAAGLWNTGTTMADVNGDGLLDLYVCRSAAANFQKRRNLLFINNGDLTFTERANDLGLDDFGYSTQASFFDYDLDGDLDMFLINHSIQEYAGFSRLTGSYKNRVDVNLGDKLFRNDGDFFQEVSRTAGIKQNVLGFGLGLSISDINQDGWPDIYVANDYNEEDYLYINQQNGTFKESIRDYAGHISMFSMGCEVGDLNNDLLPDMVTLDMLPESSYRQKMSLGPENYQKYQQLISSGFHHQTSRNMLQLNNGNGSFSEIGQMAGIHSTDWSWAPLMADFDNDGWKDLFVTNGYWRNYLDMDFMNFVVNEQVKANSANNEIVVADLLEQMPAISEPNYIYRNNGDLTFQKKTDEWGFGRATASNGAAYADFDNDGDLDLVVNHVNEVAEIYQNNSDRLQAHNYLKVQLQGDTLNTFGVGSKVSIYHNGQSQVQEFYPSRGFQSSVGYELNFGLGTFQVIDSLIVLWPTGKKELLIDVNANQTLALSQENAQSALRAEMGPPSLIVPDQEAGPQFLHRENRFLDFQRDKLLPIGLSNLGPKMAIGDVNGDGTADVYVGGAKGTSAGLFLQSSTGSFSSTNGQAFESTSESEDVDAAFFDADGDGDLDLYVVSGGNEFEATSEDLQDRLYINNGKGNFTYAPDRLPRMITSGSSVSVVDFDRDGDQDLFVGGRLVPGAYPTAPRSYLLRNEGGHFEDVTPTYAQDLLSPGMVTDSYFLDINGDGWQDLIVVGEWMPIQTYLNQAGQGFIRQKTEGLAYSAGWWNTISAGDFDGDGDADLVVGNFGMNNAYKPSLEEPATMIYGDFDGNGAIDPIFCHYLQGQPVFAYSRDELLGQLVSLKAKFPDYESFATADPSSYFDDLTVNDTDTLVAYTFQSVYLQNLNNGSFQMTQLPQEAQFAPVYAMLPWDFNDDGHLDLITGGNQSNARVSTGRFDANYGVMLLGDGKGQFKTHIDKEVVIKGDVRDMKVLPTANAPLLIVARSNDGLLAFRIDAANSDLP